MATGNLHQLQLTITGASFLPLASAFSRSAADIYMELTVDGKRGRKTIVMPGTLTPTWNEHFDILVKQDTVLMFQAFQHCKWRADVLLCQAIMFLNQYLDSHNGRFENTSLTLELFDIKKTSTKVGELFVILSGMIASQPNRSSNDSSINLVSVGSSVSLPSSLPSSQASALLSLHSSAPLVSQPSASPSTPPSTVPSLNFAPVIVPHNPSGSIFAPYNLPPTISQSTTLPFTPVRHPFNLVLLPPVIPQTMLPITRVTQMGPATVTSQPSINTATFQPATSPAELPTFVPVHPPSNVALALPFVAPTPSFVARTSPFVTFTPPYGAPTPPYVTSTLHSVTSTPPVVTPTPPSVAPTPASLAPTPPSLAPTLPSVIPAPSLMSFDDAPPVSVPWLLTEQPLNPTEPLLVDLPAFTGPSVSDVEPLSTSSALLDFGFEPLVFSPSSGNSEHLENADLLVYRNQNATDRDSQSDGMESDLPRSSRDSSVSPTGEREGDASQAEVSASSSQDGNSLPPGWERRVDRYRRIYYVDHNTRTTTWVRPSENLINRVHTFELGRHDRDSQLADITNRFLPNPLFGDGDVGLGQLPDGWERRLNSRGMPYYYNATTDTTLLEDPRIHSLLREDPLPDGWEMKVSDGGVIYYVNHTTKEQTYRDPRGKELKCTKGLFGVPLPHEKSFSWKLCQFRELCAASAVEGHIKILVSRENIFQDSFQQVMRIPAADLKRRMHVMFRGEQGLDYGGVAREWFLLLSLEILHPMLGLFQYVNDRNCTMQISAASYVDPNHLEYFRFIGRFIALAVFHGMFIGSTFCLPFYKKMLNKRLTLRDIESIDVEVYNSLKWIRDTNLNENKMPEMYFATDFEVLGRVEHYELKPEGTNIAVGEENKNEYIILMIDWMFSRGIEKQTQAFLDGFNEVLPLKWLQYFDEMELELMLCGMQAIDVNDWQRNTVYKHYSKMSKQVVWFWKFVQDLKNEDKLRLLQFVTGTCRLPVGGFAQLMGSNGLQKFCIEKVGKEGSLPRSHTCFNRLDLPPYKSYEQLSGKLRFAIHETEGFGLE